MSKRTIHVPSNARVEGITSQIELALKEGIELELIPNNMVARPIILEAAALVYCDKEIINDDDDQLSKIIIPREQRKAS